MAGVRKTMMEFWQIHSKDATVEEMMLDSSASTLSQYEKPEILSLLPKIDDAKVLELGAGIGRFTGHLAQHASHVTAVDFMQTFLDKNRELNGDRGNITFMQADVTQLQLSDNSFDVIFSNWLFMYLTDEELLALVNRMLRWLRPGGHLFFRESCFHQSGDSKRTFNPTIYRKPAQYDHIVQTGFQKANGNEKGFGFELVISKSVQTYIKLKKNQNQVCWLLEKVARENAGHKGYATFQQFLDGQQYSRQSILRYEKIFGEGYVSTGGPDTTKEFVLLLDLKVGQKVLDVGCGIGGGDFYMAETFKAEVLGMDLSSNMVEIAMERATKASTSVVQFEISDATKREFPEGSFDVVYSRDTILHIADKFALFKRFYRWLKPGGKLLISDYCCGEKPWTTKFEDYVKQRGYILYTVSKYGKFLEEAGFQNVRTEDRTDQFVDILSKELERTKSIQDEFIKEFSEDDYSCIVDGWSKKLERCKAGDQKWGLFYAERPINASNGV